MILPAFTDAREFLTPRAMSFSELATLSHCEKKWQLIYNDHTEKDDPSDAMALGLEMHRLLGNWWTLQDDSYLDTEDPTAQWLMERYHQHYMYDDIQPLHMEALEVPFAVKFRGGWIFGWMDGLVRNIETGELWITEFKTMGSWSRLHQLPVDKQITLYIWAARQMGLDVKGVMFDAILTEHWKTEQGEVYKSGPKKGQEKSWHPPADSFQRHWIERTPDQIYEFVLELESAIERKFEIYWHVSSAIRNVGQACSYCPVMAQCFGISLTLVPEDDVLSF